VVEVEVDLQKQVLYYPHRPLEEQVVQIKMDLEKEKEKEMEEEMEELVCHLLEFLVVHLLI
jgi:hypothetical protein